MRRTRGVQLPQLEANRQFANHPHRIGYLAPIICKHPTTTPAEGNNTNQASPRRSPSLELDTNCQFTNQPPPKHDGYLATVICKHPKTTFVEGNNSNRRVYMALSQLNQTPTASSNRRLAACTQAVVILRSTSYIAIELKCSVFEVVRNSIESMCSSPIDVLKLFCLRLHFLESINGLLPGALLLLVHGPLPRKMSQDRYVSLWTFQPIFFSLCRCCCLFVCLFVCFISQTRETF